MSVVNSGPPIPHGANLFGSGPLRASFGPGRTMVTHEASLQAASSRGIAGPSDTVGTGVAYPLIHPLSRWPWFGWVNSGTLFTLHCRLPALPEIFETWLVYVGHIMWVCVWRLRPSLNFVHWNTDGWKTGLCSVAPVGHPYSLLSLANNTCVWHNFQSLRDRFVKLYKRKVTSGVWVIETVLHSFTGIV